MTKIAGSVRYQNVKDPQHWNIHFRIVMFLDENTLQAALTSGGGLDTPPKDEKETSNLTLRYHQIKGKVPRDL
jgi:hypothetical protein